MNALDRNGAFGVFDAVDLGLILLDGDRRVIGWNAWMEKASGMADSAARGHRLDELFPGRIPARLQTAISQTLELGASSLVTHTLHPAMLPLRTPAGRQLVHNITVRPSGKRPNLRCLLQILDVTVVAGRERILRERQNARYDAVVSSAPDTILTLDADGTIQLVNPAAARQFGYSPDELIGHPL
jgi:PAS domain-containing protein